MGSPMPLSSHSSDTWPTRAGTAQSAVCKGLNIWRSEFHSLPTRESASLGLRFLTSAVGMATSPGTSGGVAEVPRICSQLPQPLRRAPAPAPQAGPGGRRRVLTAQVVFPHSVRLPERSAITAAAASSSTAACSRSPALLHHLPAPGARCLGRHDFGSTTSWLSSPHGLPRVPRRRCRRRKAAWDS